MNNVLFERVVELCKEKGISQRKLQEDVGMSTGALSKWKTSTPNAELLQKVADYFDVTIDYLAGKTNYRNKEHMLQVFDQNYNIDLDNKDIPHDYCIQTEEGIMFVETMTPKYIDPETRHVAETIMSNDTLKRLFKYLEYMSDDKVEALYNMLDALK
jgi:transcriptional regulator with XRE-family HTH domain